MAIWTVFLFLGLLLAPEGVAQLRHAFITCPPEWSAFGRCFKFFKTELKWTEAETECLKYGGNLASVRSHRENLFLQHLIKQATGSFTRAWLGASDCVTEGTWLWSDGSKMSFKNWGPTQPSNYLGKENCLEINYGDTYQWNDDACDVRKPFVCALMRGRGEKEEKLNDHE
ncbi:galactose-specific lectin nattectin-like [Colossoma macropomum]|uniref:galactose-specific lectin nattectin-like n=1 Tax=Colossoma macropomum TaxID=42526 RepID=UPI00186435B6|nr:galactose-specific lectin nattectin-like [Colossoma macropomum]